MSTNIKQIPIFHNFDETVARRFRLKYHPEDSVKRKEEQMAALKVIALKSILKHSLIFSRIAEKS